MKSNEVFMSSKTDFDRDSNVFKSDPESNFAVIVKLPHGPREILMDCILQGRMNFAKFSAKYEEATFASVGLTNFKLKTLAYIPTAILQKFYQLTPMHHFQ